MKKSAFLRWLKPILVFSFTYFFAFAATAQNYYPADIGNMWVLESVDGEERKHLYPWRKPKLLTVRNVSY